MDFFVFFFSSRSCEIRLLQCLRFGLPEATLNALTSWAIICFRFLTAEFCTKTLDALRSFSSYLAILLSNKGGKCYPSKTDWQDSNVPKGRT